MSAVPSLSGLDRVMTSDVALREAEGDASSDSGPQRSSAPKPPRDKNTPAEVRRDPRGTPAAWDRPVKGIIFLGVVFFVGYALLSGAVWTPTRSFFSPGLHMSFWWGMAIYGAIMYLALAWRLWLWMRYRPMESVSGAELPKVSVIIPAYNEGALVRQTIRSVAENDYPREKLQIIVVDDGSTDDTWSHIQQAVREVQSYCNIVAHKAPKNGGKRAALHFGFQRASGDVFVTMDSDSIFATDTLRNAVTPLVRDPRVGCVAGCVEVLNPYESVWTRFLKVTFSLSFKFVRAYQNEFRGIFCTPGALSVYRADVVRRVADEWNSQTFLGQHCMTGEDRAMTNLFLREGWLTAYQENARVWAEMPATYNGVTKMFLRWARSNIRETIILQRFLMTNFRRDHLHAFRINMLLVLSTLIVPYFLVFNSLALVAMHPEYLARHLSLIVFFGLTQAAIYYRKERDSDWLWLMVYEVFWVIGFVWIMPYAALTLKNTAWLTRGKNIKRGAESNDEAAQPAAGSFTTGSPIAVPALAGLAVAGTSSQVISTTSRGGLIPSAAPVLARPVRGGVPAVAATMAVAAAPAIAHVAMSTAAHAAAVEIVRTSAGGQP